jgi:hypothetical protein
MRKADPVLDRQVEGIPYVGSAVDVLPSLCIGGVLGATYEPPEWTAEA